MFAGNDPVNFADPSGLAMQGYPLAGGYSGNVTTAPTISSGNIAANSLGGGPALSPATNSFLQGAVHQALSPSNFPSTTFGGFVNPAAGNSILGLGPLSTPTVVSRPPTAVEQFNYTLSASSNLSALTRTVDPLTSLISQSQQAHAHWQEVERHSQTIVRSEAFGGGWAGADALAMGAQYELDALRSPTLAGYFANKAASLGLKASGLIANAVLGYTTPAQHITYGDGRTVMQLGGPSTAALAGQAAVLGPKALSGAPAPASSTVVQRSNAQLVQDIATRAETWGTRQGLGSGPAAGIAKHGYADDLLTRYQRMFGDRGLSTEVRYLNGEVWQQGMGLRGTIRLDVVEGPVGFPTAVFDYKFGSATLSPARVNQIQSGAKLSPNVPIYQVKP